MKYNNLFSRGSLQAMLIATTLWAGGCRPDSLSSDLGSKPKADFVFAPGANANSFVLVNKTSGGAIPYWKVVSTGQKLTGDSAKVNFIFAGTYSVTLLAAGHGGLDSVTKTVTVAQSDATACVGTQLGFITSCTQKKWKLNPEAGAYKVGPNGPDDGGWWTSGAGEVPGRACEFNDEYTFSFNAAGTFVYDNKGDFYADGYLGANGNDCETNSQFKTVEKPWGSGTFSYTFAPGAGSKKLGQLTVIGLGAHIGLQKVINGAEKTDGPVNSITYDVIEQTHVAAGNYDILKLGVNIGGGWWTFALRSF